MSTKKVVIVMGSPRKNGNSITLAQRVAKGAEAAGAEVESFYLPEKDIMVESKQKESYGDGKSIGFWQHQYGPRHIC